MKVTIVYDNTAFKKGLEPDWGFSCLVEAEDTPKILFDTGANGRILLSNMKELGIEPKSIDEVFISHSHFDHTGGLSDFLRANRKAKVYVPASCRKIVKGAIAIEQPLKIHKNVFSTGELDRIEQSMAVKTKKGIVIITGCSHPKMEHILGAASQFGHVCGIIGGLHGFDNFGLFQGLELICPVHCTRHKKEIKSLYPRSYVEGGAGKTISV